jgi:hypothetical protein
MYCRAQQTVQTILSWQSVRGIEMEPTSSTERFEVYVRSTLFLSLYIPRPKTAWLYCGFHVTYNIFQYCEYFV